MGTLLLWLCSVGLFVAWGVTVFNRMVTLRTQADNAWRQIDVQLQRRYDLIPNLVAAVQGALTHERATLEAVTTARQQAVRALGQDNPATTTAAHAALESALGRLLVTVEAYPALRAMDQVRGLCEDLTTTENHVAFARQHYNDSATEANQALEQLPDRWFAGAARLTARTLWAIDPEEAARVREVPRVVLSVSRPDAST